MVHFLATVGSADFRKFKLLQIVAELVFFLDEQLSNRPVRAAG
jgi:hypothetical protein